MCVYRSVFSSSILINGRYCAGEYLLGRLFVLLSYNLNWIYRNEVFTEGLKIWHKTIDVKLTIKKVTCFSNISLRTFNCRLRKGVIQSVASMAVENVIRVTEIGISVEKETTVTVHQL